MKKQLNTKLVKLLQKARHPKEVRWIRTGIHAIDLMIGGGIPRGRIIEIFGGESGGKSLLAWQIAKAVQDLGGVVLLYDIEATAPAKFMIALGVNTEDVIMGEIGGDVTTVEMIRDDLKNRVEEIRDIDKDIPILVIWDSVAATSCEGEWENKDKMESKEHAMGRRGEAMSKFFRQWTEYLDKNDVTLICVNQLRDKIGVMFGRKDESPGGRGLKYHASVRLELTRSKKIEKDGNVIGVLCRAIVQKNKVAPPFRKSEDLRIMWGTGFDPESGLIDLLIESGRVKKEKESLVVGDGKYKASELGKLLQEHPEILEEWSV